MAWTTVIIGLWVALAVGFTLGWAFRHRLTVAQQGHHELNRALLVAVSHLLEDGESALSSIEGLGLHGGPYTQWFQRAKESVTLAQPMVRNLLGIEQGVGRGSEPLAQMRPKMHLSDAKHEYNHGFRWP